MADNPADQDDFSSGSDGDWGADWEAAFQAEEDAMFSFDEGEYEQLFKQAPNLPTEAQPTPTQPVASAGVTSEDENLPGATTTQLADFFSLFLASFTAFARKYLTSPLPALKLLAIATPALIAGYFILSLFSSPIEEPLSQVEQHREAVPAAEVPGPFEMLEKTALRPENAAPIPAVSPAQAPSTAPVPGEKVRRKWPFAAFMIPAQTEKNGGAIAFVVVTLTLETLIEPGESLPEDRKPYLRDIIYQFYSNRPLYELRRYSLARGEMKRQLRAWIHKQWPEFPLENIIFDQYQIT